MAVIDLNNHFDLDGSIEWHRGHAGGSPRVAAALTENGYEEVGASIEDFGFGFQRDVAKTMHAFSSD
jgi:hypothetical protein